MDYSIEELKNDISEFVKEREWEEFHNPKDISQALSVEASELSELFLWVSQKESYNIAKVKETEVADEMADVFAYLLSLSNATGINLGEALKNKLKKIGINTQLRK